MSGSISDRQAQETAREIFKGLGSISKFVHTSRDTIDKLTPDSLGNYVQVIRETVRKLDEF